MSKKTLLIIGDKEIASNRPYISLAKFLRHLRRLKMRRANVEFKAINYDQLLENKAPRIHNPLVKVIFFFPYQYWNRHIEIYQQGKIYGDKIFGGQFKSFFEQVKKAIEASYQDKKIEYPKTITSFIKHSIIIHGGNQST